MNECNHVKVGRQTHFFPWVAPKGDKDVKYYDMDEAKNCPNCKKIKENDDKKSK